MHSDVENKGENEVAFSCCEWLAICEKKENGDLAVMIDEVKCSTVILLYCNLKGRSTLILTSMKIELRETGKSLPKKNGDIKMKQEKTFTKLKVLWNPHFCKV